MVTDPFGIHWFRRDLRIAGNAALRQQVRHFNGRVVGIFTIDRQFLARPDFSHNRFQFFLETLKALGDELKRRGGDLLVLDGGPDESFKSLFKQLKAAGRLPRTLSFGRDYEPFAVARDARITALSRSYGVEVESARDHLLIEPEELVKPDDKTSGYQVYTPFQKRWLLQLHTPAVEERLAPTRTGAFGLRWQDVLGDLPFPDQLASIMDDNVKRVTITIPPAGEHAAGKALRRFTDRLSPYDKDRDFPAVKGTSGFSIYFKNGSLTVPQVIRELGLADVKGRDAGRRKFLQELIWREFYYHILARHPRVEREEFQTRFANLPWENDERLFAAWQEGQTGYPIVDAGMRQLKATGWMHNRVRMIVASFLCKDLLIDWRWGERHFMHLLLDGDIAPNNGGWQWAASTGCDAQPYFRVFNPELQSIRFDQAGQYIQKYVPELAKAGNIHNPTPRDRAVTGYPQKIVDHAVQRLRAVKLYGVK